MGSQSRRSTKSNRRRDDPIHVVREREAMLCEEEKKRKNRERQARHRAKKKDVLGASSLPPCRDPAPPTSSDPIPPCTTPPHSDPIPPHSPSTRHSPSPIHDPIPPLSPTYILPPSSTPSASHVPSSSTPGAMPSSSTPAASHVPSSSTPGSTPGASHVPSSSTPGSSAAVAFYPTSPLVATSPIHHVFGTPPSLPIVGASSHGKSLSKSGARRRANMIVSRFFDDLDVPSQSRVLDSLLQHSSMAQCKTSLQICSPHSRRASVHVLRSLRESYSSIKQTAHRDGVAARRTIVAAVSASHSAGMCNFILSK